MVITCDVREREVINVLTLNPSVECVIKQLPLGDFIIQHNSKAIMIERKTVDDLSASIIDGRYKEQVNRLTQMKQQGVSIVYIIEGAKSQLGGIPDDTLSSTILSLSFKYLFHVFKTKDVEDSVRVILKMEKNIESYLADGNGTQSELVVPRRNANVSEQVRMLCSIKGISPTYASKILDVHTSIYDLCTFMKANGPDGLTTIPKIGPKLSLAVFNALCDSV